MSYILPLMILGLIIYALIKRVDVYSAFTEGAAEALPMLIKILPYMAGMLAAIQALRASGALELMLGALSPAFNAMGLPAELAPLFILRPFSGSAALSLLGDVLTTYGPDTFTGVAPAPEHCVKRCASRLAALEHRLKPRAALYAAQLQRAAAGG